MLEQELQQDEEERVEAESELKEVEQQLEEVEERLKTERGSNQEEEIEPKVPAASSSKGGQGRATSTLKKEDKRTGIKYPVPLSSSADSQEEESHTSYYSEEEPAEPVKEEEEVKPDLEKVRIDPDEL